MILVRYFIFDNVSWAQNSYISFSKKISVSFIWFVAFTCVFRVRKDEKNMHRLISVLINENLIKITVCCRNLIRSAKCLSNFYICEMFSDSYSEMSQQKILIYTLRIYTLSVFISSYAIISMNKQYLSKTCAHIWSEQIGRQESDCVRTEWNESKGTAPLISSEVKNLRFASYKMYGGIKNYIPEILR